MTGYRTYLQLLALVLATVLAGHPLGAAEIRGSVTVQQGGVVSERGDAFHALPVSVALFPAEGQWVARTDPVSQTLIVSANGIQPLYLALPRGSQIHFRGVDDVYHDLFTHSPTQSLGARLDRTGTGREVGIGLEVVGDLHWFCRIHAKSYARIDVVDTALVRMLHAGESFEFRDLPPGKWRLRVAAPGAETRIVEAEALTMPPPLLITLAVKGIAPEAAGSVPQPLAVEQLFPSQPGL